VTFVENQGSVCFAAACNVGMRMSTGREVLFLNPDTFVTAWVVEHLADGLNRFAEVGLVGPTFQETDGSTRPALERPLSISRMFFRFTPLRYLRSIRREPPWQPPPDAPVTAGYVIGACLLIRREVLEDIGGSDEGYFLYWEDMEYARRAVDRGWQLLWVSGAVVQHGRGAGSADVSFADALIAAAHLSDVCR
jgi:N-acetylglucosaminyl-diphospho-decaprenol L-rhamnosyltransferase